MGAETIGAIAGAPLGLFGTVVGAKIGGAVEAGERREKTRELETERKATLIREQREREAARGRAATRGRRTGIRGTFAEGLGFGSGTRPFGLGRGTLFGN